MAVIPVSFPHSCAVVFRNPTDKRVELPFLGRQGINFAPDEMIAVVGNPLVQPSDFKTYNGKQSIKLLMETIMAGKLEVLSIPGCDKEDQTLEFFDTVTGLPKPGTRIEY